MTEPTPHEPTPQPPDGDPAPAPDEGHADVIDADEDVINPDEFPPADEQG